MINYVQPNIRKISEHYCFVHNGGYYLTTLSVYEGGIITCWGKMDKDQFLKKIQSGWITVDIPDNVEIRIGDQDFVVKQGETLKPDGSLMFKHKWITNDSFVKDVLDSLDIGLGNKSAGELCWEAYNDYNERPSEDNKEKLRIAYLNVPEHKRRFVLGDQDNKDFPIRNILGL